MDDREAKIANVEINGMLQRLGLRDDMKMTSLNPPTWSFQRGSATIEITVGADFVVVHSKILDQARPDDVELLRRLLQVNMLMNGAFFAVEGDGNVRLSQIAHMDGLDDEVLSFLLANLSKNADRFDDVIQGRAWEKK